MADHAAGAALSLGRAAPVLPLRQPLVAGVALWDGHQAARVGVVAQWDGHQAAWADVRVPWRVVERARAIAEGAVAQRAPLQGGCR